MPVGFMQGVDTLRQGRRLGVPLGETAAHGCHVISCVSLDEPDITAYNQQHRCAAIVGLIDRHRRMLDAKGAMQHDRHGFSLCFGVAVGHIYR